MTRLRTIAGILDDLSREYTTPIGDATERMICTQMTAYPSDWPEIDKREMAELHLFGRETSRG